MQGESNVDFLRLPSTLTNPSCLIWRLAAFVPRSSPSSFFVKLTKPSVLYFYWKSKLAYDQYYKSFWSLENKFKVTWWTITSLVTIVKIEKLATEPMKVIDHMIFTSDVSRQSEVYLFWGENVFDETTYTSSRKFFFFFSLYYYYYFVFFISLRSRSHIGLFVLQLIYENGTSLISCWSNETCLVGFRVSSLSCK